MSAYGWGVKALRMQVFFTCSLVQPKIKIIFSFASGEKKNSQYKNIWRQPLGRKRSTYELLVHHTLVIVCFSIAVVYHEYVAYAALSLMVEVNSVFLHARQLFIISGEPKSSPRSEGEQTACIMYSTFSLICFPSVKNSEWIMILSPHGRRNTVHRSDERKKKLPINKNLNSIIPKRETKMKISLFFAHLFCLLSCCLLFRQLFLELI